MTVTSPPTLRELLPGDLIIELDKRKKQVAASRAARSRRGAALTRRGRMAVAVGLAVTGTGVVVGSVELAQGGIAMVALVSGCLVMAWWRARVTVTHLRTQPPMVAVGMPAQLTGELTGWRHRGPTSLLFPSH